MKNQTQCRLSFDAFHVCYISQEFENEPGSSDVRTLTHEKTYSMDEIGEDQYDSGWLLQFRPEIEHRAEVLFTMDSESDWDYHQLLSEEVCFQLADMFMSGAILLREKRRQREIAEAKAKAAVQELPFPDSE